jgi:UDP-glucose 4-epimerase
MSLAALETDATGPVNIGTGIETDVNRLAALLLEVSGSTSEVRHGPAKAGEQRRSVVDIRRAAEVFGWKPEVSLKDGLRRTVEFFRTKQARGG